MSHNEACHGNCAHPQHQVNGPLKDSMKFTLTEGPLPQADGAIEEAIGGGGIDPETASAYAFNGKPFNDPQEEYKNALEEYKKFIAEDRSGKSCPSCGYCPACGRGGAQPYFPPTQPWPPFYPNPTYPGVGVQPWITYCEVQH